MTDTICINIRILKIVIVFPGAFHTNFLIASYNTPGTITLKFLIYTVNLLSS